MASTIPFIILHCNPFLTWYHQRSEWKFCVPFYFHNSKSHIIFCLMSNAANSPILGWLLISILTMFLCLSVFYFSVANEKPKRINLHLSTKKTKLLYNAAWKFFLSKNTLWMKISFFFLVFCFVELLFEFVEEHQQRRQSLKQNNWQIAPLSSEQRHRCATIQQLESFMKKRSGETNNWLLKKKIPWKL